ncbi:MAG: hypothetical protein A3J93_03000 [Candidatus Magasanikbacteria bacterium RIFOXYC2_FULL_42_28]|uniref:N-acetyltransferase domain-containing protein n=1 Tax=Candidatus Magasanikbacteria bacterium RIFOXYC2_FULL_42_28 TaxID=1798704 RepID=A0A1F6NU77_9BACT|nr:MAG: hypothetical protein A3J93_03000 [Candidatus Magasanikbacteria bacterium RIFOXYC2_FULL_42_28]
MKKTPILKGPRIILRPLKLSEATYYVKWFRDKEVVQYLGNKLLNIKAKGVRDYFIKENNKPDAILWAIEVVGVGHIGNVHLDLDNNNKRASLGIVIGDKNYWGEGYGAECLEILGDYVFKKLKYNRLQLTVFTANRRAVRAYKKVGFKIEGTLRKNIYAYVFKKYCDEYVMAILKDEWFKK